MAVDLCLPWAGELHVVSSSDGIRSFPWVPGCVFPSPTGVRARYTRPNSPKGPFFGFVTVLSCRGGSGWRADPKPAVAGERAFRRFPLCSDCVIVERMLHSSGCFPDCFPTVLGLEAQQRPDWDLSIWSYLWIWDCCGSWEALWTFSYLAIRWHNQAVVNKEKCSKGGKPHDIFKLFSSAAVMCRTLLMWES